MHLWQMLGAVGVSSRAYSGSKTAAQGEVRRRHACGYHDGTGVHAIRHSPWLQAMVAMPTTPGMMILAPPPSPALGWGQMPASPILSSESATVTPPASGRPARVSKHITYYAIPQ